MSSECGREDLGSDGSHDGIGPSDASSDRNQGEHVEVKRLEAIPASHEEGPATPEHNRCRHDELDPIERAATNELNRRCRELWSTGYLPGEQLNAQPGSEVGSQVGSGFDSTDSENDA